MHAAGPLRAPVGIPEKPGQRFYPGDESSGENLMTRFPECSRRQFLRTALSTTAASVAAPMIVASSALEHGGPAAAGEPIASGLPGAQMKLSFMTFVCPEWNTETLVKFATKAHYDGVEIRVDAGHKHGISSTSSAEARRSAKKLFRNEGVEIASVATSVQFASPAAENHKKNLAAAKANLDLAADLGAPVVRIFAGGGIPKLTPEAARQVAAAFDEVGEYAKASGACPILECGHDIIKGAAEAAEVLRRVRTQNFGALWNDSKMDDQTFDALKGRLRHFHVHDEVLDPKNTNLLALANRMKPLGYRGYVSLEIIWGKNVPEGLLIETASRLKRLIAQGLL
jgi:sugar phosphate isomerase/epimerase